MARKGPADFLRVSSTPEEIAQWHKEHGAKSQPRVYRVECRSCHKRLWGSGIGIGAHRRACPGEQR
jgi:hypothetical protein